MFETYADMLINTIAAIISYIIAILIVGEAKVALNSPYTIAVIFANLLLASFVYHICNLYRPSRYRGNYHSFPPVFHANLIYFGIMEAIAAIVTREEYRPFILWWLLITALSSTAFLTFKRHFIKVFIRMFKLNKHTLKKVIIVGDNTQTAKDYIKQVQSNPSHGIMVLGYVGEKINPDVGAEKLGHFRDFAKILDKYHPTDVVFAIDAYDKRHLIRLVNMCDDRCIKVYFLPVIYGFFKNPRQIEQIGSMPVINIHSTPLDNGANAFLKRLVDIVGSLLLIILTAPVMIFAAIGVYVSSPGPILFRQSRVGRLGKKFTMLKFRSMRVNFGSNNTWTTDEDSRKTRFGTFLRRTAIDELPQLFNVLGGSMSLVGPRPELPVFVETFKEQIPLYMIKHYVKPGLTGLAQVKGLRGDTSIEDRIHEDIEYIENWSFWLDIYILLKTPFKAFNKNEKYKSDKKEDEESKEEFTNEEKAAIAALLSDTMPEELDEEESAPVVPVALPQEPIGLSGKKILYAASVMSHINNFHRDYIEALRNAGNEVLVMAKGEGADFHIPFEKKFFSSKNKFARKRIKEVLLAGNFDIIITNTTLAAFHIRLALPLRRRPRVVNIVHGYLFSENSGFIKRRMLLFCERLLAPKTDALIVMNKEDMKIARKYRLSSGRVYFCRGMGVKPRAVSIERDTVRKQLNSQSDYVMAFVGELSSRKNQEFLIRSMPRVKGFVPEARLWLIGEGEARAELEALAERCGVREDVLFLGKKSDVGNYINAADLYVSASKSEGMPFNIVEAMMLGKTMLVSRAKGQQDVVVNDVSGFLFEMDKSDEFAESVKQIHDGEKKLLAHDITARGTHFSHDEVFSETLQIIMEACDARTELKNDK